MVTSIQKENEVRKVANCFEVRHLWRLITLVTLMLTQQVGAHAESPLLAVNPGEVRPTQGVVGFRWVGRKVDKFEDMKSKELDRTLTNDPAPAVRGPDGTIYILDNHHEFYALVELGIRQAYVRVIDDLSHLSWEQFYKTMLQRSWFYLGDENGNATFTPETLPTRIALLRDDPFRSLAGFAKKAGAFKRVPRPFYEFDWANEFRKVIPLRLVLEDFDEALKRAIAHAKDVTDCQAHLVKDSTTKP